MADSDSLFYLKSQFYLGAYKSVVANPSPAEGSADYLPTLLYTARAHIALKDPQSALKILPEESENAATRAVRALAEYSQAKSGGDDVDTTLEELRDLCIEIEGEEEGVQGAGTGVVKLAAASAFVGEGELEEALATLGAGTVHKDLECVSMTVQIYLSISRPDLAKKEYEAAKQHADDTLLVQLIEASIGVVVGGNPLRSAYHIYAEQASAPGSSSNAAIITSKGISQLLRGNLAEAEADIDEALRADPQNADALAASVVIAQLSGKKGGPDEALARLQKAHDGHPLVADLNSKSSLFDEAAAKFVVSAA